ncbi:MAG: hypothetical protein RLZZ488_1295 [Pseudomonadota bacterium]|jgi:uncharacterized protein YbjT (DUF2867 family)
MKKALVAGGTGLVGSFLLKALQESGEFATTALVRRAGALPKELSGTHELVFDFENPAHYEALEKQHFDFVFCCLGTTIKKAGSAEQFRRVDFDYPKMLLDAVKGSKPIFALVSSVGANAPFGLYLKTKADLENALMSAGVRYVIARPSLLLGERSEFRPAEAFFAKTFGHLQHLMRNHLGARIARNAPIHASEVAKALLSGALETERTGKNLILEGRGLIPGRLSEI